MGTLDAYILTAIVIVMCLDEWSVALVLIGLLGVTHYVLGGYI